MDIPIRRMLTAATLLLVAMVPFAAAGVAMVDVTVTGPDGAPVPTGEVLLYRPLDTDGFYAANRGEAPWDEACEAAVRVKVRNGRAFVDLPAPGAWRLVATAPGLAPAECRIGGVPGMATPQVKLCLGPCGTIEGRVLGERGRPVRDAVVLARSRLLEFEVRTRTDAEGRYRLSGLLPGENGLWVRRPDGRWVSDLIFHAPSFARRDISGVDEKEGRRGTSRRWSEWEKRKFTKGTVTVRGVVRDGYGEPIPLALVETRDGLPVLTDEEGRFTVSGFTRKGWAFMVYASKRGYARNSANVSIDDPEARANLVVGLERRPVIRGRVKSSAGLPVGGGLVWVAILHFSKHGGVSGAWGGVEVTIQPDGTFVVPVASQSEIDGRGSSSWTGVSKAVHVVGVMVVGHGPAISEPIELETGRMVYPVRIDLSPALRLSGVVRDVVTGRPVAGARVTANRKGMHAWPPSGPPISGFAVRAITDEGGRYEFGELAAGELFVRVVSPGYEDGQPDVVLPADGPLEIPLRPLRTIAGVVVDLAGQPVAGADVRRVDPAGEEMTRDVRTDKEGRFWFHEVPAGDYIVTARRTWEDDLSAPALVENVAAGREDLRLVLRPGEVLEGRVLDGHGKPLADVVVSSGSRDLHSTRCFGRTGEDGSFRLTGLMPGLQIVTIRSPATTIRSVRPGVGHIWRVEGTGTISGRIRRQEFNVLGRPRGELVAIPLGKPTLPDVTRRHEARIDPDDGTFTFRHLPDGEYRIEGEITSRFRLKLRTFRVRGEVLAKAGDRDVEVRLLYADD